MAKNCWAIVGDAVRVGAELEKGVFGDQFVAALKVCDAISLLDWLRSQNYFVLATSKR